MTDAKVFFARFDQCLRTLIYIDEIAAAMSVHSRMSQAGTQAIREPDRDKNIWVTETQNALG